MKFAHDTWFSVDGNYQRWPIKYDKLSHFLGGVVSSLLVLLSPWLVLVLLAFWWGWEVKDGFVLCENLPERYRFWGGDGFSWKDGIASTVGVLLGVIVLW